MLYFLVHKKLGRGKGIDLKFLVKILKFIILLILLMLYSIIVKANEQLISVKFQKAKLNTVLKAIANQTDYQFFYNDLVNVITGPVTIDIEKGTVVQILELILPKEKLAYEISENQITISIRRQNTLTSIEPRQENIQGTVRDTEGKPLPAASVSIKGTNKSTSTDQNGKFEISALPTDIIIVSFLGYKRGSFHCREKNHKH